MEMEMEAGMDVRAEAEAEAESISQEEIEWREQEVRDQLAKVLVARRDAAIKHRIASGIEKQWAEDQAYYEGEDETARSEWYKGTAPGTPMLSKPKNQYKSRVFLNITRPYVETAASKVVEVLCPVDDRAFSIEPRKLPLAMLNGQLVEFNPLVLPEEQPQPQPQPGQAPLVNAAGAPATTEELSAEKERKRMEEKLRAAALGAQRWIDSALAETNYNRELRRCVDEAARLGTGIMRGPIPGVRISRKTTQDGMVIVEDIVPESKCISVWNAYPDPACGDDIHNGQFFVERDSLVEKDVRKLALEPGYIAEAIEAVIDEGPKRPGNNGIPIAPHENTDVKLYDIWYYHGILDRDDMAAMGCLCDEGNGGVPAVITMINDTPVKAHLQPMSDGKFPYDFMCWQRTAGKPWGIGIARQIRGCQAILNANVRAMMENAGLSSGPQIILGRGSIVPADNEWSITPRKIWLLKPDADIQNVQQAFNAIQIPSIQQELLQAIDFALKMAENVTGLPILLQGQQGPTGVPETVGGMQILVSNASSLLRRMARIFDDYITKPHITRYYQWIMDFVDDESIKGDFHVVPRGSTALVIKDMRNTFLLQTVPQLMANPGFGIDPARYFREVAKINGLNPSDISFTEAELQVLLSQPQEPAERVQAAQVQAQGRVDVATIQAQGQVERIKYDRDRDTIYIQAENQRTQASSAAKMAEFELRRELAMLDYANKHQITLEQIKAKLAVESGKMDLQRELSTLGKLDPESFNAPDTTTPSVEPPGRAPAGQAFIK